MQCAVHMYLHFGQSRTIAIVDIHNDQNAFKHVSCFCPGSAPENPVLKASVKALLLSPFHAQACPPSSCQDRSAHQPPDQARTQEIKRSS